MSSNKPWAHGQNLLTWRTLLSPGQGWVWGRMFSTHSDCSLPSPLSHHGCRWHLAHVTYLLCGLHCNCQSVSSSSSKVSSCPGGKQKGQNQLDLTLMEWRSLSATMRVRRDLYYFSLPHSSPWVFCKVDGCCHVNLSPGLVDCARVKKETV